MVGSCHDCVVCWLWLAEQCVSSVAAGQSPEATSRWTTAPACTASLSSSRLLPLSSMLCTVNNAQQAASLPTKRKRKFPGPAGALPKLVSNDLINPLTHEAFSYLLSNRCPFYRTLCASGLMSSHS